MDFTRLVRRVLNMITYGVGRCEIHDVLVAEGIDENTIFFVWIAATMLVTE